MPNKLVATLKKALSVALLVLILITTCLLFVACGENTDCIDGESHYFSNKYGNCMYCHKKYCEAYGQHKYVDGYCDYCGLNKSDTDKAADGELPIGGVIGLGVALLVVGLILHRVGIGICSPFLMRAPLVVFVIMTFGAFLAYGVLCGIIMAVFLIIYVVASIAINRQLLDYDDIF